MSQLVWIILKQKKDDLDVGKLKKCSFRLQKLSDGVDKEVVENTKFNTLKTKVNNLGKKIPEPTTTLKQINQYNIDKQSLVKKDYRCW